MDFNLNEKIEEVVKKLKGDSQLMEKFKNDPISALEGIIGVDLPDEQVKALIAGVQAKLGGKGGSIIDKIKGLF